MKVDRPQLSRARGGWLIVLAALAFVVAYDAPLPTSAEINSMDVWAARAVAIRAKLLSSMHEGVVYTIDDVRATAEQARALPAEQIARIIIRQGVPDSAGTGSHEEIDVTTRDGAVSRDPNWGSGAPGERPAPLTGAPAGGKARAAGGSDSVDRPFDGLIMVNGVQVNAGALDALSPSEIRSVEVVKGVAASKLYTDPKAANGVILITTRTGSSSRR